MLVACGAPPTAPVGGPGPIAQPTPLPPAPAPPPPQPAPPAPTEATSASATADPPTAPPPQRLERVERAASSEQWFDKAMKDPTRRDAMRAMLAAQPGATGWTQHFCALGHGVVGLMETYRRGDATWEVGHCCKPHDCGDDGTCVVFADGGKRAFAQQRIGKRVIVLGRPDPKEKAILDEACGGAP
jgi:Inhibitor of vertebrate lysozyme (Ivy)